MTPFLGLTLACFAAAGCQNPATPRGPALGSPEPGSFEPAEPPSVSEGTPRVLVPEFREPLYSDLRQETRGSAGLDFDVDVAPDGGSLVFASTRYSAQPKIFLKDADGALVQKTSGPQRDIQPKLSPDGKWIAYTSDRGGNFDILIIRADRNEAYWQVTRSDRDEVHPSWSPDGKRLAYCARDESDGWNLMIADLDSRRVVQLGMGRNPEWSPDGGSLAFERDSGRGAGHSGIWIVGIEGGAPREVYQDARHGAVAPSWSPDSSSLVFATITKRTQGTAGPPQGDDLWVVELRGMQLYRLTQHAASDSAPAWGLDDRIYFTSRRGEGGRLWSLVRLSPASLFTEEFRP